MKLRLSNDVIIIRMLPKIALWKIVIIRVFNRKKFPWKFVILIVIVLRGSVVA